MTSHDRLAYQPALDGLRAVAVGAVVAYHLGYGWAPGGFLGVDAFFVLSGFLITTLLLREASVTRGVALGAFWARRARRLLPAVLLVIAVVTAASGLLLPADLLARVRGDALSGLTYVANWRFVLTGQSYFDLFSAPSPFRHLWSLAIEEQFYLLWPLLVLACLRLGRGRHGPLLALCVAGITASAVAMAARFVASDPSRAYYGTDARAHTLLVGAVLAIVMARRWEPRRRVSRAGLQLAGLAGAVVMVAGFTTLSDHAAAFYRGGSLAFAAATGLVIAAAVQPAGPLRRLLSPRPLRGIGMISYGIYLWHWPVIVLATPARTGLHGVVLDLVRIGLTVAVALLSFFLVERPIRRGTFGSVLVRRSLAPVGFASVAVVVLVGTAGATATPAYLRAAPGKVLQVHAPATVAPAAPPTTGVSPTGAPPVAPRPQRILLAGDSVAYTLAPALSHAFAVEGIPMTARTVPGCGLVTGIPTLDGGQPVAWGKACSDNLPNVERDAYAEARPDLVLWLSTWESSDRLLGGRLARLGTPEGDAAIRAEIDQAVARLTGSRARVLFLTVAPPAAHSDLGDSKPAQETRVRRLNALLVSYAVAHADRAATVDFASIVCPGGTPCPTERDGVTLRPRDGSHFSPDGAAWVAPRLVEQTLACFAAPDGPACPQRRRPPRLR